MSKSFDPRHITKDRLSTTDERGKRLLVHPAEANGKFRNKRKILNIFLINFFLIAPWIKINGNPLILMDLIHRKFSFFGVQFWADEAPLLLFVLLGFTLSIAFITSIWGRIWCGWACPQTVFITGVYRRIEALIEGDSVKRRQLEVAPWDFDKLFKRTVKWMLFIIVSMIISHSFLAYFIPPAELMSMIKSSPRDNMSSFLVMAFVTALVAFDFGWFREQFCIIMCPYGRFQSLLMDDHSQVIAYDTKRGEPRTGSETLKADPQQKSGDCVNCFKCVQVCPTGIDIRNGSQMECVACTACMDACNEVMEKTKRPLGLVRYTSKNELEKNESRNLIQKLTNPRSLIYVLLLTASSFTFSYLLSTRKPLDLDILRSKESPYQMIPLADQSPGVINHFKMNIRNRSFDSSATTFKLIADTEEMKKAEIISQIQEYKIEPGKSAKADFFVKFPKSGIKFGHGKMNLEVKTIFKSETGDKEYTTVEELRLVGPSI